MLARLLGMGVGVAMGCGNVNPHSANLSADAASVDDASVHDAALDAPPVDAGSMDAPPPPPCDLAKPFGTPSLVVGVNSTAEETQATLSWDELTIYVASTRAGGLGATDMYSATRATKSERFGALSRVAVVNSTASDESPSVTKDGLSLYFASTRAAGATFDLHVAARMTTAAEFGAPSLIAGLNTTDALDGSPYINAGGTVLYFDSDRGGNREIYRAARATSTVAFNPPTLVGALNSPTAADKYPVLSSDELSVYFGSDRPGGVGIFDIWEAHRTTTSDGFGSPKLATNLNSIATDLPTWISADGCRLLLTSDRAGGTGGRDIYIASRP